VLLGIASDPDVFQVAQCSLIRIVLDECRQHLVVEERHGPEIGDGLEHWTTLGIDFSELFDIVALYRSCESARPRAG